MVKILPDAGSLAAAAAGEAASRIRDALAQRGRARIIAATGTSQVPFLDALVRAPDIDWTRVEVFHLDEYLGLPADHPASFRRYLIERLIRPAGVRIFHAIDGERDPGEVCARLGGELRSAPIDV